MNIGGLEVPIEDTPFGPRATSGGDDALDRLQWIVNAALEGELPGLAESIEHREPCDDGAIFACPVEPGEDLTEARAAWRARTGGELGDDVYCLALRWRGPDFYLPRAVLAGVIRELEARRAAAPKPPSPWLFTLQAIHHDPHPDEALALRELEARARDVDALAARPGDVEHRATVAAKRRLLLAELEPYGILSGPMGLHRVRWLERWALPTLLGYQHAALAIGFYWSSEARRGRIGPPPQVPSVLGATVSVDWFRRPAPVPAKWDADDWLAFCERTLLDARLGDAYDGDIFVHQGGLRVSIAWRRDDGVHAAVVRAAGR